MKKRQFLALTLVVTMLVSVLGVTTGCKRKGETKEAEKVLVAEDSLWYNSSRTKFDNPIKKMDQNYDYSWMMSPQLVGNKFYSYGTCEKNTPDNYTTENFLFVFDMDGKLEKTMELDGILPPLTAEDFAQIADPIYPEYNDPDEEIIDDPEEPDEFISSEDVLSEDISSYLYVDQIMELDGEAVVSITLSAYDMRTYNSVEKKYFYYIDSGECVEFNPADDVSGSFDYSHVEYTGASNGLLYAIVYCSDMNRNTYQVLFYEDFELVSTVSLLDFTQDNIWMCSYSTSEGDDMIFSLQSDSESSKLVVNSKTFDAKVSEVDDEGYSTYYATTYVDGKKYYVSQEGIFEVTEGDEDKLVLSFDDTNFIRSDCWSSSLIALNDDYSEIKLMTEKYSADENQYFIYTLTKADTNPNVGKSIITIGNVSGSLSDSVCAAIYDFNNASSEYFIKVKSYGTETYEIWDGEKSIDENRQAMLEMNDSVINELAMDLLAGDGPDIIADVAGYTQLNNEDYLIDLSSYIEELDQDDYFINVIDAARAGDALFQLPTLFTVQGILTDEDNVKSGNVGFTFDEYADFVSDVCDGRDPMAESYGRMEYFQLCLAAMSECFYDDEGNVDFKNDDFYDLAKYCLENCPEDPYYMNWDDEIFEYYGYSLYGDEGMPASFNGLYDFSSYMYSMSSRSDSTKRLYGIPSSDGRGPFIEISSSMSISSSSPVKDGAWEFIKMLLSSDSSYYEDVYSNSICKSITRSGAEKLLERERESVETMLEYNTKEELESWGFRIEFDDSMVDDYIDMLSSASAISSSDTSIMLIILEEIPAYFAGQKDIEAVAGTIQNRAQTVINER